MAENDEMDDSMADLVLNEAKKKTEEMQGGGAIMDGANKKELSAVHKSITAQLDLEGGKYRQAILMASFLDTDEADNFTAALAEAQRYGCSIDLEIDWLTSRCAVLSKGGVSSRIQDLKQMLTHMSITTPTQSKRPATKPNGPLDS